MGESSKYCTHVLEFIRNNGFTEKEVGKDIEAATRFLMFDYFDVLLYRELKGEDKSYLNYLAIADPFKTENEYKISYKTLSLYQLREKTQKKINPFLAMESETLSDFPFLGIIQISLCEENYKRTLGVEFDIEGFLQNCENDILQIVNEKINEDKKYISAMQLYRSSTTGDFCLALRTNSVDVIYKIALALSGTQDRKEADRKFMTYTNIGMECRRLENGKYCTLNEEFKKNHKDISFVLRFSADEDFLNDLKGYVSEKGYNDSKAKGLFGRYDYLLNVGMEEFAEIYPYLCKKKLGLSDIGIDPNGKKYFLWEPLKVLFRERKKRGVETDRDEQHLKQFLENPYIRNINERVLVNIENIPYTEVQSDGYDPRGIEESRKKISDKNRELYERIVALRNYKSSFSEGYRVFEDLYRGMIEIFKTYSALGMEKDAYINWKIYHRDMRILCTCFETWIAKYNAEKCEEKKQELRVAVLYQWRMGIQAINQYTRLVQNVNYQTYQSPIYEIQTQIDTEKAMVAYRESMEQYITSCKEHEKDGDSCDRIYPILYPDLIREKIEVQGLFKDENAPKAGEEREAICICTLPSFEYFGRLYDILPWIIHETSHHIRVLRRKERNEFIIEYIFSYIFQIVIEDIMKKLTEDELYGTMGIVEFQLVACMVEVVKKDFRQKEEKNSFNFEGLIENIKNYLKELFPFSTNDMLGTSRNFEQLRKTIVERLVDECRKEEIIKEQIRDRAVIDILRAVKEKKKAVYDIGLLIEHLLDRYFKTLKGVLEKVLDNTVKEKLEMIHFDKRHLQWTMWQIETEWIDFLEMENVVDRDNAVWKDALKEYYSKVKKVYRIYELYRNEIEEFESGNIKGNNIRNFLEKVFAAYKEKKESKIDKGDSRIEKKEELKLVSDPSVMHAMRRIGLIDCNGNRDKKLFCNEMENMFRAVDSKKVEAHMDIKVTTYREACADLMMAVSLNLNGFGYCRQVLQIISDTKVEPEYYDYEENNYERFRIVTAFLLWKGGAKKMNFTEKETNNFDDSRRKRVKIDGKELIRKGREYCLNTLKCIQEKILKNEKIKEDNIEETLVKEFINIIYVQSICDLGAMEEDEFDNTFLYMILHGRTDKTTVETKEEFDKYKKIVECCGEVKYIFWRLDCFIRGLSSILQRGCVEVSEIFLKHMDEIYGRICSENKRGCKWEESTIESLLVPKLDVGEFYNDPEKVYSKTVEEKLENTIDFIQNYYYYNRFRIVGEENGEESKKS